MAVSEFLPRSGISPAANAQSAAGRTDTAPIRFGLAARLALWVTVFGTITAAAIAYLMYRGAVDAVVEGEVQSLSSSVNAGSLRFNARIELARQDVLFLSRTLPVARVVEARESGGIDPVESDSEAAWRDRLAAIFAALLASRPTYMQVRFLDADGYELVRVDRLPEGTIRRMADTDLQPKGDHAYFTDAVGLAAGEVYVSDFELNRERGAIEVPHRPVIRTATPVFDRSGRPAGVVIINVDAARWFDLLAETLGAGGTLYVANADGDYLVHPDPAFPFGFELGTRHRLADDLPALAAALAGAAPRGAGGGGRGRGRRGPAAARAVAPPAPGRRTNDGRLAAAQRIGFDPRAPERHIIVAATVDDRQLLGRIHAERDRIVLIAAGLILVGAVVAFLLARAVVRPLRGLTAAAMGMAAGERGVDVGAIARRRDETGVLARAFDVMARQIDERERDIGAKAAELARSNQELSQFAYIASHDLQEPLRMVGSYLGLIARRYRGQLDAEADEFIAYAVDGAARMKRLINDLLGYSRVSNRPLAREPVDTGRVVASVTRVLAERIGEAGAEVAVAALPVVDADPSQMEQLFLNLLDNAVKYRGTAAPRIRVSVERRGRFLEFAVADNGIGIDPQFKDKVFEIFTRLNGREKYDGTGIGLASCRKIVERHGGSIWVEPAPGGGSVFRFTLPTAPGAGEA